MTAYQIATLILISSRFLVEAADGKASAAICPTIFRQVTPRYWNIVHDPTAQNNSVHRNDSDNTTTFSNFIPLEQVIAQRDDMPLAYWSGSTSTRRWIRSPHSSGDLA